MGFTSKRKLDVENSAEIEEFPKPKGFFGKRHMQLLLLATSFFNCYAMRVSMSVTIVAMTHPDSIPSFEWSETTKNFILSSFFWGYILTQIPGGLMAQKSQSKNFFGFAVGLCGFLTLMIPFAARAGVNWVCACRIACGLCQGVVMPMLHTFVSNWAPQRERATFVSMVYGAGWFGNVSSLLSSGILCYTFSWGWEICFVLWGAITVIWSICWIYFGHETPNHHPAISVGEKNYIKNSLNHEKKVLAPTPWKAMLMSVPVFALLVAQCSQTFGFWMLATKSSEYLDKVLNMDLQSNGIHTALPYLTAGIFNMLISWFNTMLIKYNILSTWASRMLWNGIGMTVPAFCLFGLSYVQPQQSTLAIVLTYIGITGNIAIYSGHHANHLDLSPNYAGILMGVLNTFANLGASAAPLVHGVIVKDTTDPAQWRNLFFLTGTIWLIGAVVFQLLGSTETQPWNDPSATMKNDPEALDTQVEAAKTEKHIDVKLHASGTQTNPPESEKSQTLIT